MSLLIDSFRESWSAVRGLTYEFVGVVPAAQWTVSPRAGFAPFHKQVRHMVCVQGVYQEAFAGRTVDFSRKHEHYAGDLERGSLVAALKRKDDELDALLERLGEDGAARLVVPFFGKAMSFARYCAVLVQHEALHHGEWSFYAALGGFATPPAWKLNWGL